jgi:hypothetical protein
MDVEHAQQVRPGDVVTYQKARRRVIAVSQDGLWAPYFELDEDGVVSHLLVEVAKAERLNRQADRRAAS